MSSSDEVVLPNDATPATRPDATSAAVVDGGGAMVVLCTTPDDEAVAARLARGLVSARLAACVNLMAGVRSFYRWEGAIADDGERLMVIKTHRDQLPALTAWLSENHPYDVPEVVALPIEAGSGAYLAWLQGQL